MAAVGVKELISAPTYEYCQRM